MTELSDEMKEAIRILREDGQIASYNAMSKSHQEMIQRFDEVENNWSEFRATQNKEKDGGTPSSDPPSDPPVTDGPQPPPVKEETPVTETKTRLAWWERGSYAQ